MTPLTHFNARHSNDSYRYVITYEEETWSVLDYDDFYFIKSDLFEVDVGSTSKRGSDVFSPLSLALRVVLSAHCIDIMWQGGDGLIWGETQTTASNPGLK